MEVLFGRAGPIGRQGNHGRGDGQCGGPVVGVRGGLVPRHPVPLPAGVVVVLPGQFRQRGVLPLPERGVHQAQLPQQQGAGPAVEDDVMGRQQQNMVSRFERYEAAAHHGLFTQAERSAFHFLPYPREPLGRIRQSGQILEGHREPDPRRIDDLERRAAGGHQSGAQGLVPGREQVQRLDEQVPSQWPPNVEGHRLVVGGAGVAVHASHDPQTLLRQ